MPRPLPFSDADAESTLPLSIPLPGVSPEA
jgi:hypothetical protein